jgi:beta-N-acetylhexosaminidase
MMSYLIAVMKLLLALALVLPALDWRSPLLATVRPEALICLLVLPIVLILAEIWALRNPVPGKRLLKALNVLGLVLAVFALTSTLAVETRFHWVRHQVLQADVHHLEKLGRHVVVGYRDLEEVRELVRLRAIAGIFLSGRNVSGKSPEQIRQEIRSLQSQRQQQGLAPLWIATDQEGGVVARLSPPLTSLPGMSGIVERYSDPAQRERAVRQFAAAQGRELAELGVNLNFAPVVDINHRVRNPNDRFTRIYRRAISDDPVVVAQVAAWYCAALDEAGVRCTLKHFPGLGRVRDDTHLSHASLTTPVSELTKTDWLPFRQMMSQNRVFTMLGHVRLAELDPERPVSVSPSVVAGLLRGKWKHEGVLITDDFSMHAVYRSGLGVDNGSVEALNAGVDLLLVSWDSDQYYRVMNALLKAHLEGRLDAQLLRLSDQRLEKASKLLEHRAARSAD